MRNGLREMLRVLRAERRLVCPWKPRRTWYGQAAAGMAVVAGAGGALAGLGYSALAFDGWLTKRADEKQRKWQEEMGELRRHPAEWERHQAEAEACRKAHLRPSEQKGFNDDFCDKWHDARHWPSALAWTGAAVFFVAGARWGFRGAQTHATTLCGQGVASAFSGGLAIVACGLGLRAADNAYAFACKRGVPPNEARAARIRHSESLFRRSPLLSIVLEKH
jgi:hypothetical protein